MSTQEQMNGNGLTTLHYTIPVQGRRAISEETLAMSNARSMANEFFTAGMEQYDNMIVGETDAKQMYLALLAMGGENGMAGMLLGHPGTGKSQLLKNGHRIVEGIDDEHVAKVEHREDMTPAELVGKTSEFTRSSNGPDGITHETISGKQKGIIRPGIKVVKFDELNRTSPVALNAALELLQDGKVEVGDDGEKIEGSEFDLVVSSINHYGTAWTHRLDPALAGRHGMGAITGRRESGKLSQAGETIWDNPNNSYVGKPRLEAVTDLDRLHFVRSHIDKVEIPAEQREYGKHMTATMLDALEGHGMSQGDPRVALQIVRISRAFSMLNNQVHVTDANIRDAVKFGMTPRLGSMGRLSTEQIDDTITQVINQ
jgi:MoxR-like ATPase